MKSHSFPQGGGACAASYEAAGVIGRQAQRFVFKEGSCLGSPGLEPWDLCPSACL